jgi:hypothetical protein
VISKNVMKMQEWDTEVWYRIGCDCTGEDCSAEINFEFDKELGYIDINFYKKVMWNDSWGQNPFYKRWWARIKASLRILFTGYIEMEGNFMIQDIDHMESFIEALEEGKQKILKLREKHDETV